MKILFDQNLSHRLVVQLAAEFPGSEHVRNLGMASASDADIWRFAKQHGFVIASKDADFEQRSLLQGHPPKVVWLQLGNCSTAVVEALLRSRVADLLAFFADSAASILVLS